jgi:cytochrome c peroxidase
MNRTTILALCAILLATPAAILAHTGATPPTESFRRPDRIPFPDANPYAPAKAELGRRLFFDAILSDDRTRSCASCHSPDLGWSDGRPLSVGREGAVLKARSPHLANLAWQGAMGWDGKFPDIEGVAFGPISGTNNMNLTEAEAVERLSADPSYAAGFAEAFGSPGVDRVRIERALGTFVRLVVSGTSPFDRFVEGDADAMGASARRGFALFAGRANCAACHSGWSLGDGSFHDIGHGTDPGRGALFPRSESLRHAHKTPGLRDVASRGGPYMHDGALASLEDVVDLYDKGGTARPSRSRHVRPLGLTPGEKADLLAFLKALDSDPGTGIDPSRLASMPSAAPAP